MANAEPVPDPAMPAQFILPGIQSDMLVHTQVQSASIYSGPIPSPADLRAYGEVAPDLVDRIVKMAESEQAHRHKMEETMAKGALSSAKLGMLLGAGVAVSGFTAAAVMAYVSPLAGAIVGSLELGTIVLAFLRIRKRQPPRPMPQPARAPAQPAAPAQSAPPPQPAQLAPEPPKA